MLLDKHVILVPSLFVFSSTKWNFLANSSSMSKWLLANHDFVNSSNLVYLVLEQDVRNRGRACPCIAYVRC